MTVKCQNCAHDNPDGAKFCSQCGNSLPYPCPVCGVLAQPEDRFCRNCGNQLTPEGERTASEPAPVQTADDLSRYLPEELLAKMRSARDGHAMEGERRTVTMLFADVQGSTSSAEQLDPEDWAEIMNGAYSHLIAPIYRYEGTLAQLRGDAVLAFFGAPIAHEDDPVRALRSGLEIVSAMTGYSEDVERQWGVPAHVRVGINTGLVVVGAMGSDLRVEYSALGDAINVAARMEQTAAPDTVRVTGHTLSLTHGAFAAEELGPIDVKGKADPVPSFRVVRYLGAESLTDAGPMVGRATELTSLEETRSQVVGGSGRILSVIAEAGVGKSRLLEEFGRGSERALQLAQHFDAAGDMNWLRGSSRSYETGNPYSTISDMLGEWWSVEGSEPSFERVEAAVAAEGLDDPDASAVLAFLTGIPLSEEAGSFIESLQTSVLSAKANRAAIAYFETLSKRRPTLIVLEDLHWSDDLSLALIEDLMTLTESVPLGLVLAMRPYRDEPSWRIHEVATRDHHHRYTALTLEPLDLHDSSELLDALVESANIAPKARQDILDRSQGNPLYLEQMARSLAELETGELDEGHVPSSLRGLLTARLDRLGEEQRYLVQMASVLGSEFNRAMLANLVDHPGLESSIAHLLRVGILVEPPDRPNTLGFRHALIQEAAYETILRRTRRTLHRRVADHLIAGDGDSAAIARHLMAADDVEEAYPYLVSAGVAATRAMGLADAIELLHSAIENTPEDADPELVVLAHDTMGDAYALIPDLSQASAAYQRLYEYGESTKRPEAQVAALNRLAYATASIGADLDRANEYLVDARRIAEESNDEMGLAEYHMNACFIASMGGKLGEAAAHDEETVRLGDKNGVAAVRLLGMARRATNYINLLDWERGIPAVESALEEAAEMEHDEPLATVKLTGTATMQFVRGDIRESLEVAEEAVAALGRYGSFFVPMGHQGLAARHFELGEIEEALSQYLVVTRVATDMRQPFTAAAGFSGMALVYAAAGLPEQVPDLRSKAEERLSGPIGEFLASSVLADLGFTSLLIGAPERAIADFDRGLLASSISQFTEKPRLLVGRALAHVEMGNLDVAAGDLADAVTLTEAKGLGLYEAHVSQGEGLFAAATDDLGAAEGSLVKAQEAAMSRGQRIRLIEIMGARAHVARLTGDAESARAHSGAARSVIEAIAAGIADEALRTGFISKWEETIGADLPTG